MDKEIRNLIILTVIVVALMIASTYMLSKPKILGSPGSGEINNQNSSYFLIITIVLVLIFVFLIVMIGVRYAKIKKQQLEKKQPKIAKFIR